jgi:hypothetical protein
LVLVTEAEVQFALTMPHQTKFFRVVEPDAERRRTFGEALDIPKAMQ